MSNADPGPMAGTDLGPPPGSPETLTVSELCARVGDALSSAFDGDVWVQGAISGLTRSANGHVYFDLIDPTEALGRQSAAVLPVALFASQRRLVNRILLRAGGMRMHDGIEIRIRGQVTYYPPQGRVQLVMTLIDPAFTLGQMVQARRRLLDALAAEELLEANSRLSMSPLPLRVGLITSDQSAAYFDFVKEITASGYPFAITLIDARVQGAEAGPGLRWALQAASDVEDLDVVVLVRGGGARTDLTAFDDEGLARAIATHNRPVVVGVGHEIDRSVADEVAHTTTKTPTAAARFLIDRVAVFDTETGDRARRLAAAADRSLNDARSRLLGGGARLAGAARRVGEREQAAIAHRLHRLETAPDRLMERRRNHLALAEVRLSALDPVHALRRGWTITHDDNGRLVRAADQVAPGRRLHTTTAAGTIVSIVTVDADGAVADGDD